MKKPDRALISSAVNSGIGIMIGVGIGMLLTGAQINLLHLLLLFAVPAGITLLLGMLFPRKNRRK